MRHDGSMSTGKSMSFLFIPLHPFCLTGHEGSVRELVWCRHCSQTLSHEASLLSW